MRKPPAAHVPTGVYVALTDEIERFIDQGERGTQKRLAVAAGLTQSQFRHRMDEYRGERFSFEEIEAIRREADAPPGWPYIPLKEATAYDAFRKLLNAATK